MRVELVEHCVGIDAGGGDGGCLIEVEVAEGAFTVVGFDGVGAQLAVVLGGFVVLVGVGVDGEGLGDPFEEVHCVLYWGGVLWGSFRSKILGSMLGLGET